MVSEVSLSDDSNVIGEKPATRSSHNKKNTSKVPKKIHKAEREKKKRDHLNVLFLELGDTLESAQQNSGKASILSDTTRLLRDLLGQISSLRKENKVLLYESQYVTAEKNELKEENSALEAKIEKLQRELKERNCTKSSWNLDFSQSQHNTTPQLLEDPAMLPAVDKLSHLAPVLGPLYVVPLHQDLQAYPEAGSAEITSKLPTNVRRPHARYPSPSDAWPSQILVKEPVITQQPQHSCSTSTSTSSGTRGD